MGRKRGIWTEGSKRGSPSKAFYSGAPSSKNSVLKKCTKMQGLWVLMHGDGERRKIDFPVAMGFSYSARLISAAVML